MFQLRLCFHCGTKSLTEHLYCKKKINDLHSSKNCRVCDTVALSLQAQILCGLSTRMYSVQLYLGEHEGGGI